ncbi:hypothetical protein SCARR_05094 [Pontiella sulfatireligans]|uniref:Outer membrane lipoprotein-sorting protein n=2 Tax=Pontiella sulfatireligans TaxID=2750658 RepID=A0A6C2URR0_9BACT|nr:hypothetical protein SCARR_05094 [Pontiella sulfatireligans]
MKSIKSIRLFILAAMLLSAVSSFAGRMKEVTLVMVPRDEASLQKGLDLANRYPTLLLSYKIGARGEVSLHGWAGSEWVNVTPEKYKTGEFFRNGPNSALLIEEPGMPIPESLVPPVDWVESVYKISTTDTRPLLHLIGQYYDFDYKDWKWFANRYGMDMASINPEGLNIAWYHQRLDEHLKARPIVGASDLQYWFVVRIPEPVVFEVFEEPIDVEAVEESVVEEEMLEEAAAEEEMAEDFLEMDTLESPLTNEVPAAVIMGVADAEEAAVVVEEAAVEAKVEQ